MDILNNWIKENKEWEFDSMLESKRKNLSIDYLDKLEGNHDLDLYLIADDDKKVYFMVLNNFKYELNMLDYFRSNYGCTIAWYWSRKDNNWRIL